MPRCRCFKAVGSLAASLAISLFFLLNAASKSNDPAADGTPRWVVLPGNVTVHRGIARNPHHFTYIINNDAVCSRGPVRLLVLIASNARSGAQRRRAIRETWGQRALQWALHFRLVFLLADPHNETTSKEILRESYTYGDIVQEAFDESFHNLALKSVMGIKWAVSFCSNAGYVVKTDDDIFLHIPNLISALDNSDMDYSILCHPNPIRRILRDGHDIPKRYEKYLVTRKELPGELFPQYCGGFAYGFTWASARKLYQATMVTPVFFIEDVYVTGFCRLKAGLKILAHESIALKPKVTLQQASCVFGDERRITSHEVDAEDMRYLWNETNTQGFFCPKPVEQIRS
ncbi:beta-1,3-galactosyltransferase 1-like [Ornithodoros turicata]|uniref:beta-1,3-galactosyltransferase 1-like n=1 Tax=Ornithodoros turicata TaxID=34597 RepID=UPI003139FA2A